jgi:hypothetical protein
MTATTIRNAEAADEKCWRELFRGYAKFYYGDIPEKVITLNWAKFHDPKSNMGCLVAERDGTVIGLCHYLFRQST